MPWIHYPELTYINHIKCMIDLHYVNKNIFKLLNIDSINKIKMFYLCVNAINKKKHILNKWLTHNILIDIFRNDIVMTLNGS